MGSAALSPSQSAFLPPVRRSQTQPGGKIYFTDPRGQYLPDALNTRSRGNVFSLMTKNSRSGIKITPETGKCRWDGETRDDDLVVLRMLQLEQFIVWYPLLLAIRTL